MNGAIQFDAPETAIGGVNVAEAVQSEEKLIFNESYTVIGEKLTAPALYACYNLTVIGDVDVEEIEVGGNLYVTGDIRAEKLSCLKSVICGGNLEAGSMTAGDVVADNIACGSIACAGNIVARTTIDARESLRTECSAIAGEGILGGGQFSAKNAVAVEYVDFQGDARGRILELATDAVFGETPAAPSPTPPAAPPEEESLRSLSEKLREKISRGLKEAGDISEDDLIEFVEGLSAVDEYVFAEWRTLTEELSALSHLRRITNLRDYLILIMAAQILPDEIISYETLEHLFDIYLPDAERALDRLPFRAKSMEDFAYALKIVHVCEDNLRIGKDEALRRIFQSVGVHYQTVKSCLPRSKERMKP